MILKASAEKGSASSGSRRITVESSPGLYPSIGGRSTGLGR